MKKVLIIGDSSVPPREELSYENTYTAQLRKLDNCIVEVSAKTGNNSRNIYIDIEPFTLYGFNPDVVILNYGIVDVFPRPYPNMIYRLLSCSGLLPYVDQFFKKTKLYYRLGNLFNFKEVCYEDFAKYSEGILQKLLEKNVGQIIIVGIIRPYKVLLNSKRVDRDIQRYNDVLETLSFKYKEIDYIDIYSDATEDFTIWDGYHYSKKASDYLANKLKKCINHA